MRHSRRSGEATADQGADPRELLTVSFADIEAGLYGQARLELCPGEGLARTLVAVFAGRQTLIAAESSAALDPSRAHDAPLVAGPLTLSPREHATSWSASFAGGRQGHGGFAVELDPVPELVRFGEGEVSSAPSEQFVGRTGNVSGTVNVSGRDLRLRGVGQVVFTRRPADPGDLLIREVDAWLDGGVIVAVRATRPRAAMQLDQEQITAFLLEGEPPEPERLDEARLSTAYDAEGRQQRVGLELWPRADSDYPRRAAGEALCSATVIGDAQNDQAGYRWDCAFMEWHMEGHRGAGPYSLLRRQPG